MGNIKSVCVYCGASNRAAKEYKDAAVGLGKILADNDVRLVYGGGQVGLMGQIANSVMENNGKATGFITQHLHEIERGHTGLTKLLVVDSMHERKWLMFEETDAIAVLPGGFGSLDEICEIITWRQLGLHNKPIVFVDINNYWSPLFDTFVKHMIEEKFVRPEHRQIYDIVDNIEDVLPALEAKYQGHDDTGVEKVW